MAAPLPERLLVLAEQRRDAVLGVLLAGGVALRIALIAVAENRLDADEATVGVMALDILEGRALPFFFYGQSYNGGAAVEAYLGAAAFALTGASEVALKGVLLGLWLAAAFLFTRLCRRVLPARTTIFAVLFFCVGTPFLLEWSVKARGGYAETLLVSIALLWLAIPPPRLQPWLRVQGLCFGVAAGLGLWASEMLLLMIPCAGLYLVAERPRNERFRAVIWCSAGFLLGSIPLFIHNLTHDWQNFADSTLASVLVERAGEPLSLMLLQSSASFVLGPAPLLLGIGLGLGAIRIARQRPFGLSHVLLLHTALFTLCYWIVGTRFLPGVAPARVLYVLCPGLAITLACGIGWEAEAPPLRSWLGGGAVALWLFSVLTAGAIWAASGVPRESGSWRGSWALTDGPELYRALSSRGVDTVIVAYWTRWPLQFAARVEQRRNPQAPALRVHISPRSLGAADTAAFAIRENTPLLRAVRRQLVLQRIAFERSRWRDFAILSGLDAARIRDDPRLPAMLDGGVWKPPPSPPDGFN